MKTISKDFIERISVIVEKLEPNIEFLKDVYENPSEVLASADNNIFQELIDDSPENKYLINSFSPKKLSKLKIDLLTPFKNQYLKYVNALEKYEEKSINNAINYLTAAIDLFKVLSNYEVKNKETLLERLKSFPKSDSEVVNIIPQLLMNEIKSKAIRETTSNDEWVVVCRNLIEELKEVQ